MLDRNLLSVTLSLFLIRSRNLSLSLWFSPCVLPSPHLCSFEAALGCLFTGTVFEVTKQVETARSWGGGACPLSLLLGSHRSFKQELGGKRAPFRSSRPTVYILKSHMSLPHMSLTRVDALTLWRARSKKLQRQPHVSRRYIHY